MNINQKLAKIMDDTGVTQYRLSKETGISQPYIGRILKSDKAPPFETLEKLCSALGITLPEFFAEDSESNPKEQELLGAFRALDNEKQDTAIRLVKTL